MTTATHGGLGRSFWGPLLALLGLVLALLVTEVLLRRHYYRLPSLMGLGGEDYKMYQYDLAALADRGGPLESLYCPGRTALMTRSPAPRVLQPGASHLAMVGDSVVAGHGAPAGKGVAALLEGKLRQRQGQAVALDAVGLPGAGICEIVITARRKLKAGADALVVVLFADDLEDRMAMRTRAGLIAFPQRISSAPLRYLASHSYVANLVWLVAADHAPRKLDRPVDEATRELFTELIAGLIQRARQHKKPLLLVLLGAAGQPFCPADALATSRCQWMKRDLNTMAALLDQRGFVYLDLRKVWDGHPPRFAAREQKSFAISGMAVHPNGKGHELLMEKILPAVEKILIGIK